MKKDVLARVICVSIAVVVFFFTWFTSWPAALHVQRPITSGNVYGFMFLIAAYIMWSAAAALRDYTSRIATANGWFHFNDAQVPAVVGGLWAWTLGGIRGEKLPISTKGSDGTLITVPDACNFRGTNLEVDAVHEEWKEDEIPPSWLDALKRQGKTGPYYLAIYPAITLRRSHVPREKLHELMLKSMSVNHAEARLKEIARSGAITTQHQQRMLERATDRTPRGRFARFVMRGDNDSRPPEQGP